MFISRNTRGVARHDGLAALVCAALLSTLAWGRLSVAAQEARAASCLASLKQLGIAVRLYTTDFDDYLPQSVNYSYPYTTKAPDPDGKSGQIAQQWLVHGGYADLATMRDGCPEYPADKPKYWNICGYAYNAYLGRYDDKNENAQEKNVWYRNFPARRAGDVKNPGGKFIMGDTVNYLWLAYISDAKINDWRHENGSNFLYFDGQAKNHPKTDFAFQEDKWDKYDPGEIAKRLWPE